MKTGMRHLLLVSVLCLLFSAGLAAAALSHTIAGIKLGDTVKIVMEKLGPPDSDTNGFMVYKRRGLEIEHAEEKVFSIIATETSTEKTDRGIGIGSSVEELKKAYPKLTSYDGISFGGIGNATLFTCAEIPNEYLEFFAKNGKVCKMILSRPDEEQ